MSTTEGFLEVGPSSAAVERDSEDGRRGELGGGEEGGRGGGPGGGDDGGGGGR